MLAGSESNEGRKDGSSEARLRRSRKFSLANLSSKTLAAKSLQQQQPQASDAVAMAAEPSSSDSSLEQQQQQSQSTVAVDAATAAMIDDCHTKEEADRAASTSATSTSSTNPSAPVSPFLCDDLIVEHFGFHPLSFIDEVFGAVHEIIYSTLAEFENFVEGELATVCAEGGVDAVAGDTEAMNGMTKLETLMFNAVDRNLDMFEVFVLRNVFHLPSDRTIVLPHYQDVDFNATEEDELALDREISSVLEQIRKEKALNEQLTRIVEECKRKNPALQALRESMERVLSKTSEEDVESLAGRMEGLRESMARLRAASGAAVERAERVEAMEAVGKAQRGMRETVESVEEYLRRTRGTEDGTGGEEEEGSGGKREIVAGIVGEWTGLVDSAQRELSQRVGSVESALDGW